MFWCVKVLAFACALLCAPALIVPALAAAQVQPYGLNDFGGFRNVLPPGTNGLVNTVQLGFFEATGARPPHNNDQLQMYSNLTTAAPDIQPSQIGQYFKDATFGVRTGNVQSTESPEPGVTIVRDSQFGVPHIYGDTRAALMYGIGFATAEDRLFFIDALRHAGQGDLAQFAGGANVSMDRSVWASEPYTQQDLVNQINYGRTHSPYGQQVYDDATNYVAGINAYISRAENPLFLATALPAEYVALGISPKPFTLQDLVSIATLVGGIFGVGGGDQLNNALLYQSLEHKFGRELGVVAGSPQGVRGIAKTVAATAPVRASVALRAATKSKKVHKKPRKSKKPKAHIAPDHSGYATFLSFVDPSDPEAPTTVHGTSFPYQTLPLPSQTAPGSVAFPDPGSVQFVNHVTAGAPPASHLRRAVGTPSTPSTPSTPGTPSAAARKAGHAPIGLGLGALANAGPGLLAFPRGMSNALLVSAAHSASGHPIAVMGPQVSYFTPEILMEEDIHGPGIDANGAAFPGVNLYVELGHGQDYAWSATSAGQNIVDTFAVPLCDPSGGKPSITSSYYMLRGRCVQMETLTRQESWQPNLADPTPAGSITLQSQRTAYGIVIARARIYGAPVVYCNLRSTYMHELDSATGFMLLNEPSRVKNPQDFFNAAYNIDYTFNWFYADDKHIAYFNSGLNPVRAPGTNPLFPTWASFPWRGYQGQAPLTPSGITEQQTPQSAHPQVIDQAYLTSWNNKQAPGFNDAATGNQFSSVYRSQLLDNNINSYLSRGQGKMTLTDLINAMGNAGTQDLRGVEVLPYVLKLVGTPSDPKLAHAIDELQAWVASGSHRINRANPGAHGNYEQTDAVRIMDAWWPLLIKAEFAPLLGQTLLDQVEHDFQINDQPGHGTSGPHLGSAWDVGFYGIVQKDLRAALGQHVAGPLNRVYCGNGSRAACRAALDASLSQALAETPQQVYPADGVCPAGDQMCSDSIQFRAIGAISQPLIEWVNRPTFQQAVEIQGHGPR